MVDTLTGTFPLRHPSHLLATAADLILIAPATADVIAKLAHGIADDMLTTVVLAAKCKKLVAPAMNTAMLEKPHHPGQPEDPGALRLSDHPSGQRPAGLPGGGQRKDARSRRSLDHIARELARPKTLQGVRVTVTAPPRRPWTRCASSPTHSSGRMGYAIAREAMSGGPGHPGHRPHQPAPGGPFVDTRPVTTAADMFRAVQDLLPQTDILIKAAAVADYRPATVAQDKMKKSDDALSIPLARTDDILGWVAQHRHPGLFLSAGSPWRPGTWWPTPGQAGAQAPGHDRGQQPQGDAYGFRVETNVVTLITRRGSWPCPGWEGPGGRPSAGRDPKTAVGILGPAALGSQNWG